MPLIIGIFRNAILPFNRYGHIPLWASDIFPDNRIIHDFHLPSVKVYHGKGDPNKEVYMTDIILSTQNGEPVASSRQIAESFGKAHRHVLDSIESILEGMPKIGQTPMFYKTNNF